MHKTLLLATFGAALFVGGTANAQSFTYETDWKPVESIGGLSTPEGPIYRGGVVEGTSTTTYEDGTKDVGTVKCVGMGQPDGGIFAIHLTCNYSGKMDKGSLVYGCNWQGTPGPDTPLGCVGSFEATSGERKGRRGSLTMDWYSNEKSSGTGQWHRQGS